MRCGNPWLQAGRDAGGRRGMARINLVPRAQDRCGLCPLGVRAPMARPVPPARRGRARGRRAVRRTWHAYCLGIELYTRGFQHECRSNAEGPSRLDHRAVAVRLSGWRHARSAVDAPGRRARRSGRQCLDRARQRRGAGAPTDDLRLLLAAASGERARLPLYGVPFAIKDNIDAAGWPHHGSLPGIRLRRTRMPRWCGACAAGAILISKGSISTSSPPVGRHPRRNRWPTASILTTSAAAPTRVRRRGGAGPGGVLAGMPIRLARAACRRAAFIVGSPERPNVNAASVVPHAAAPDAISIFALTVDDARALPTSPVATTSGCLFARPAG